MTSATHPVAPEELMALLDGELSADRAPSVSAHAESCTYCQEVLTSLRSTSQLLTSWTVGEAPSQVTNPELRKRPSRGPLFGSLKAPHRTHAFAWAAGLAACFLLLMAITIPNLLRSRMAANEASSIGSLRAINAAAEAYAQTYGHYPRSLKELGPSIGGQPSQNSAGLIDGALADGEKSGYRYSYQPKPGSGYSVNAEPLDPGSSGYRHFSTDQTGVLNADNLPFDAYSANGQSRFDPIARGLGHGSLGKLETHEKAMREVPDSDQSLFQNGPMIARTVSLSVIVKDFDASRNSLDAILVRHNGYSANLTVSTPQGAAKSLQASLRIPAPQLNAALADLKSLGRVENESQNGEEVTQQHADLVARLKNSRETEQRLQSILTERTGKISDVLEVEQEIARVRGEIEQMEAEQKNLEHRVDFATVDLKLSEEYKAQLSSPAPAISTQIHNALVNGYRNVADTLLALILFFAEYGPVLLLWCVFLFIPAYLVWKRWRAAMATA